MRIWNDKDFRELSLPAKMLYLQLMSQEKLSYAGVLDLTMKRWAGPHPDLATSEVGAALDELDAARFVVLDQETEELLVRSFIRNDELYKQPNVLAAALRTAFEIESPVLRAALAAELRRLPDEITGPAPAFAADALEAGARTLPADVKAAMSIRGTVRPPATPRRASPPPVDPAPADDASAPTLSSPNPSANPSPNPSAQAQGEGSRERETGEPSLTSGSEKGGTARKNPAAAAAGAGRRGRGRPRKPTSPWQAPAAELVATLGVAAPPQVVARLVAEVVPMLESGIDSRFVAAGLRRWTAKALPLRFFAEFVGEEMRADRIAMSPQQAERDAAMAARFEMIRAAAIAEDDTSPLGRAVRAPHRHLTAGQMQDILDGALRETLAGAA
ncbi:hypothetical protein [Amycolatopsis vastitatis]|uniref:hypothetical protein n=1 Tax=Amycolatopsis vastitatis TaxID=1905142 RepID=UPI0011787096|nr:hypothetical protein [Amycolatopsis vastitatis]